MTLRQIHKKLKTIVNDEILSNSAESMVKIKDSYIIFGKYRIVENSDLWNVYDHSELTASFSSSRSALSWCILNNLGHYDACRDLTFYDNFYSFKKTDLERFKIKISTTKDPNARQILAAKASQSLIEKFQLKKQLNKCINLAKYYQTRGIDNETARTNLNEQD